MSPVAALRSHSLGGGFGGSLLPSCNYAVRMASNSDRNYRGSGLGLPEAGAGAAASQSVRVGAFVIDLVFSGLIAFAFTRPELPRNWSLLVWIVMTLLSVSLFGSSPGQTICGIRVAPVGGHRLVGLWALPRTALIFVIVPVLITNRDGRGLHDRVCRTVVVRSR